MAQKEDCSGTFAKENIFITHAINELSGVSDDIRNYIGNKGKIYDSFSTVLINYSKKI